MKALIDGDVLRYEVGFGAEKGWRSIEGNVVCDSLCNFCTQMGMCASAIPPWRYVQDLLHIKLEQIVYEAGATSYTLYLTKGKSFRHDIAKTRPYKGNRVENKPYHWQNLTAYMIGVLNAEVVEGGLEADDAMAIESVAHPGECIICSRDKDLRQVPGHFYSWELHLQPSFGPCLITPEGSLTLDKEGEEPRLSGTGFSWFAAQCLMGDRTDNIPGLPRWGPVKTYEKLKQDIGNPRAMYCYLQDIYEQYSDLDYLLEQGRLCWLVRRMNEDGTPQLWSLGQYE